MLSRSTPLTGIFLKFRLSSWTLHTIQLSIWENFWTYHLKKDLRLPSEYKFYSLKDTGITDLIKARTDLLSVRDQARHHSLQMTDLYTPLETRTANESIRHHESYF